MVGTIIERFEAKIRKRPGCWEWQAFKLPSGYGMFGFAGRTQLAHRVAWMLYIGEIPDGLQVLHHCDNPSCVNPSHLFLGTNADNMQDKADKGRCPSGEKHCMAKLTQPQVDEIRSRCAAGERQRVIAKEYGVDQSAISFIVRRVTWAHI